MTQATALGAAPSHPAKNSAPHPATQSTQATRAAATAPGSIQLHVESARSVNNGPGFVHQGDPVDHYKWIINIDDTGDPGTLANQGTQRCLPPRTQDGASDPNYADTCPWPSTRYTSGFTPIVAQGDETDLNDGKALTGLPPGKYLISVTADGFKIDGKHFTVASGSSQRVTVAMHPTPLPLMTLRLQVFNDNAPVDGTYEVGAESPLQGFTASITDVFGLVSTDYYGNALCTKYVHDASGQVVFDADNHPVVDAAHSTGKCVSDDTGEIVIPNLGPNRYAATVSPPAGQTAQWAQTTTLEGAHDYDIWQQEGETGFDTEQTKGAELVPMVQFGFAKKQNISVPAKNPPTGEIKGVVVAGLPYIGGQSGQVVPETGFAGAKVDGPISRPWVALSDLDRGDAQVYVGRGDVNGKFDIKNVPNSTYQLTVWDDDQDYILWPFQVTVEKGQLVDVGNKMIVGWFTHIFGKVFIDSNGNGRKDPGERSVPQFPLTVHERDNSLMDQYTNTTTTDSSGNYDIRETYPLGKWLVLEAFDTRYKTTGISYRAQNETKWTTKLGAAVDVDFLPIIGLGGEIDWGVEPFDPGTNGGIAGTVTYDTTRNELDPADAATESYQPGIPGVPVHLYLPKPCDADTPAELCRQGLQIEPKQIPDANGNLVDNPDNGAFVKGPEVQESYTSEEWAPPRGCTARDYTGAPLTDQLALPDFGPAANRMCVEAPMMGVTVGPSDDTPGNFGQTVNGNYGFSTANINLYPIGNANNPAPAHDLPLYAPLHCTAGASDRDARCADGDDYDYADEDLPAGDYLVSVDIPNDPVDGKPMYQVTKEEDVNVFDGDSYLPQENFPPTVAEANDPAGPPKGTPTPPTQPPSQGTGIISPCGGRLHQVDVTDAPFLDGGGSPFQGQDRPLCDTKLVTVRTGQTTAPNFNLFTPVPIPTHFWGLTINDLGLSLDKRSTNFGEAQGLPFVPVGLYDWSGRLVDTVHTDFNGMYEALEPSTDTYNCPVPAGPCPNMYRFVGNDPGKAGALNADYNPRFRTIATNFQGWPGLYTVTDTAPTQVASTALSPGSTVANPTVCDLGPDLPQLLAVDRPYIRASDPNRTLQITGFGFGDAGDSPNAVTLGGTPLQVTNWSNKQITVTVPASAPAGPATLQITGHNGQKSINGITIQLLSAVTKSVQGTTADNPLLAEVGPGKQYATVQDAIEHAVPTRRTTQGGKTVPAKPYWLVVVWPNAQTNDNPHGEYTENVIVHHQVHIQGVGPGGFDADGTFVPGSILDGAGFNPDNPSGQNWIVLLSGLTYSGDPAVPDAAVVTVLDDPALTGVVPKTYPTSIDGFTITGGAQSDFPGNINEVIGGIKTPYGADGALITQGGGIYAHANVQGLQVTDNVIRGNGGSYGGAVRVGTPFAGNLRNYGLLLSHNQIRDNGGTNLAGGIGLFTGSDGYRIDGNAICGNFSAEYGGALTAYGYNAHRGTGFTPGGSITNNRIWYNASYDEGGAVEIAGELPPNPKLLSEGSGPVTIDSNVIQANLANDDGGGIRLLMTSGNHISEANPETISITNNTIANNVSTHEGGGIALDDAMFVNVVNNTIVKNLTTATAITSDGQPAPAGLSTAANSLPLQNRLKNTTLFPNADKLARTDYSAPTILNDVFWDNRAGSYVGGWVYGIGGKLPDGTDNPINHWDLAVVDEANAVLRPTHSVMQVTDGTLPDATNSTTDPGFTELYDVTVNVLPSRTYPAFRQAAIVAEILPPTLMGNYHLAPANPPSSARGLGAGTTSVSWGTGTNPWSYLVAAPPTDIDGDVRPTTDGAVTRYDAGSDQQVP